MKAFSLLILHCVFLGKVRVVSTKYTRVYIYVYYIHLLEKRKRVGKKERAWVVFCCPLGLVFALSDPQSQRERVLDFVREREREGLLCFYLMADAKASKWIIKLQYVWTWFLA